MSYPDDFDDLDFDWDEVSENCGAVPEDERANYSVGCLRSGEEYCSFFCPFHSDVYGVDEEKGAFNYTDCRMCGNEWKNLNEEGYCSSCWTVWNS